MSDLNEMREQRGKLVHEARQLLDRAEEEKRDFTTAEEERYNKIMADQDALRVKIDREEETRRIEADMAAPADDPIKPDPGQRGMGDGSERRTMEYRGETFVLPETADAHSESFNRFLQGGMRALSDAEIRATQADSDVEGGYLVTPQQFALKLLQNVDDMLYMRKACTVIPLNKAESLGVCSLDTDYADSDWTAEIGEASEDTALRIGKRALTPHQLTKLVKISRKLIRQAAMPVESIVRTRLAYRFGLTEEKAYLTGTGAQQPLGIFTASDDGITTSQDINTDMATDNVTADGLKSVKGDLKMQHRTKAQWLFHRDCMTKISQLKLGDSQYIWQPGLQQGDPDKILGHPVIISENVPNTFTTGQYVGAFGDFSYYWIAVGLNMEMQVLTEKYATTNQVGYIGRMEIDGMPVLAEAFRRVKLA